MKSSNLKRNGSQKQNGLANSEETEIIISGGDSSTNYAEMVP